MLAVKYAFPHIMHGEKIYVVTEYTLYQEYVTCEWRKFTCLLRDHEITVNFVHA